METMLLPPFCHSGKKIKKKRSGRQWKTYSDQQFVDYDRSSVSTNSRTEQQQTKTIVLKLKRKLP